MSAEAFEDGIDLQVGLIDTDTGPWWLRAEGIEAARRSYPFPVLTLRGDSETRRFRTVLLENPFLRVTILPGLGGRILSIFDKRTQTELLPRGTELMPQPDARRGAALKEGLQFFLDGSDRLNSLGNVDVAICHPQSEEEPAAAWIAETSTGSDISFHYQVQVPPHRAELSIEVRIFNRSLGWTQCEPSLRAQVQRGDLVKTGTGAAWYDSTPARDCGLAVVFPHPGLEATMSEGHLIIRATPAQIALAPRQMDAWSFKLVPLSQLGTLRAASAEGGLGVTDSALRIQSVEQRSECKVVLQLADGQAFEAPVDLYPETITALSLCELPQSPIQIAVLDGAKNVLIATNEAPYPPVSEISFPSYEPFVTLESSAQELWSATRNAAERSTAYACLATKAMREGRFATAAELWEQSLQYNSDDALAWWLKAMSHRLAGENVESPIELPNAHYLAPLEPCLRAEAYLAQSSEQTSEPNPLLEPLTDNPESFLEVACRLIECGLWMEASRWIDEALRHRNLSMLRVLQAHLLLTHSRMATEAASQVQAAASADLPPNPCRSEEWEAISALRSAGYPLEFLPPSDPRTR